jgi:molybdenum cofactor cytidylyltransferase
VIAALLLAAGAGRRFGGAGGGGGGGGGQKLVQDLDEKPVIRWSAELLIDALLLGAWIDEIFVIVADGDTAIRGALQGLPVHIESNARASEGMASSIACGIAALRPNVEAALVVLGDEPRMPREVLTGVIQRFRAGGAEIVAPTFRGVRGHPVLFARSVFPELAALTGDRGARGVADRVPERLALVDFDMPKPIDIDTPDDLARVRAGAQYSFRPSPPSPPSAPSPYRKP